MTYAMKTEGAVPLVVAVEVIGKNGSGKIGVTEAFKSVDEDQKHCSSTKRFLIAASMCCMTILASSLGMTWTVAAAVTTPRVEPLPHLARDLVTTSPDQVVSTTMPAQTTCTANGRTVVCPPNTPAVKVNVTRKLPLPGEQKAQVEELQRRPPAAKAGKITHSPLPLEPRKIQPQPTVNIKLGPDARQQQQCGAQPQQCRAPQQQCRAATPQQCQIAGSR